MSKKIGLIVLFSFVLGGCNSNKKSEGNAGLSSSLVTKQSLTTARLLNKNQIVRSLYSVAGIEAKVDDNITAPALGSDTNKLSSLTSPMIFALSSAVSNFCDILRRREENSLVDSKKYFINLLGQNQSNSLFQYKATISEDDFNKTVDLFAQSFWGRLPTAEEVLILKEEGFSFYQVSQSAANTKRLGIFVCISMLSSFETYTY
jgi:hypothetical protein